MRSQGMASSGSVVFPTAPTTYLERHIQQLAFTFVDVLCNQKDMTHPFLQRHVAPDFQYKTDFRSEGHERRRRDSHLTSWQQMLQDMPNLYMDMVDISPDVDKSGLRARTWCWKRDGSLKGGLRKESVSVMSWELRDKVWVCVEINSMLGVVGF